MQALGLQDPAYPKSFLGADARAVHPLDAACWRSCSRGVMLAYAARYWLPVARHAAAARARAGATCFAACSRANRDTQFRRRARLRRRFATPAQFRDPRAGAGLRDAAALHRATSAAPAQPALTAEAPLFYAQTSGSTGTPKYIPITADRARACIAREQALFILPAVSRLPGGVRRQGAGHHGCCGRRAARLRPRWSVRFPATCIESLPASSESRFVAAARGVDHRRLRPQVSGDSAARACSAATSPTSDRRIRRRFFACSTS